jgi:hypothetical protein
MATKENPPQNPGNPEKPDSRVQWHPAFVQAMRMELEQYMDVLEFHDEFRLTSEPLEIDMVIIKKTPGAVIGKNIAQAFRSVNLVEYKSPDDYFSVYDFYKVLGYAALYASFNKTDVRDMTVTIVETRHPREFFKYIREDERYAVEEMSPGIYGIRGHWIPVQVVESKKLTAEENLWLKGLNRGLNKAAAGTILEVSWNKGPEIAAYLHAVMQANPETIQEVLNMGKRGEITLEEVLEKAGLTAKWEARGERTAWEKFVALMRQGYTADDLERMAPGGVPPSAN